MLRIYSIIFLCGLSWSVSGQATQLGTQTVSGAYTSYGLTDLGIFRQVRVQATVAAASGSRNWEFYEAPADYDPAWRPWTGGLTLSSYNATVAPVGGTASALNNVGFGGSAGLMPAIVSGNYYTFNVTEYSTPGSPQNEYMGVLETAYNPVSITSVIQSPGIGAVYPENSVYVTVNTSGTLSAGEYVYLRYSTTINFASSTLLAVTMTGTTGNVEIPCQSSGTTIYYYAYTSNRTSAAILADVGTYGQVAHDMSTLSINNNGGPNYIYTVLPSVGFCGDYYVPSVCYPTIASFVTALNAGTVSCDVVCNVAAGHTETAPVGGIHLTQTGTAANTITFIKSGAGANPIIYAPVGTVSMTSGSAVSDGIFSLNGSDYITIDAIDLVDNNISGASMMEYGYALFKNSISDGCQYNIIRNCNITLNQDNYWTSTPTNYEFGSTGILMRNSTRTVLTTLLAVNVSTGRSDGNSFYGNTISDVINGFVVAGYNDPTSPYTYYDQNNSIGIAGNGNIIQRYGNDAPTATISRASGFYGIYQNNITITDNTIQSSIGGLEPHSNVLYGIFMSGPISGNQLQVISITYNDISLYAYQSSSTMKAIKSGSTSGVGASSVQIIGNVIHDCSFYDDPGVAGTPGGEFLAIDNVLNAATVTISDNQILDNVLNTSVTGNLYLIYNSVNSPVVEVSGNLLQNNYKTLTSTTGIYYGYYSASTTATGDQEFHDNVIDGFGIPVAQNGSACGVRISSSINQNKQVYNNTVSNMTGGSSVATMFNCAFFIDGMNTGDAVYGNTVSDITGSGFLAGYNLYANTTLVATTNLSYVFHDNIVDGLTTTTTNTGAIGVYAAQPSSGGGAMTYYNNTIQNITSTASFSGYMYGMYFGGGTSGALITFYNNNIHDVVHTGTTSTNHTNAGFFIISGGAITSLYGNSVKGVTNVATNGIAYGMYISNTNTVNIYNNYIQQIKATASGNSSAVNGIYCTSTATSWNIRYNTVALGHDAALTSTGTNFGFTGILVVSTTAVSNVNNNIVYVRGTPNGSALGVCLRSNLVGTAYTPPSGLSAANNNYYYINSSAWNYIYTEGYFNSTNVNGYAYNGATTDAVRNLNNDECFNVDGAGTGLYRAFMSPAESNSRFDVPPFVGGASYPANLKLVTGSTNYAESNAAVIAGITMDYEGDARSGSTPDIGADEGAFLVQTDACYLLPLELLSFSGYNAGTVNHLLWITATEMNSDYFLLERSPDGFTFTAIGAIEAAGFSIETIDYAFVDDAPLYGHNYYRLRMVDVDGSFTYSNIVLLNNTQNNSTALVVYPNPVADVLYVAASGLDESSIHMTIFNAVGQVVAIPEIKRDVNSLLYHMPISHLPAGTYVLRVTDASGNTLAEQFVKK